MSDSIVARVPQDFSANNGVPFVIINPMPQIDVDKLDDFCNSIDAKRTGMVVHFKSKESLAEFLLKYT